MYIQFQSRFISNPNFTLTKLANYNLIKVNTKLWTTDDFMVILRLVADIEYFVKLKSSSVPW